jgi:hypothetical protein
MVDLTLVDGQTRVSDVNADEGSPHHAGSNTLQSWPHGVVPCVIRLGTKAEYSFRHTHRKRRSLYVGPITRGVPLGNR